ncbi:MAG: hypothetical protein ABSB96_11175 [Gaiellaceae bacterium]
MDIASVLAIFFAATAAVAALLSVRITRRMWIDQRRAVLGDRLVLLAELVVRAGENCINNGRNALFSQTSRAWLGAVLASIESEDRDLVASLESCQSLRDLGRSEDAQQTTKKAQDEVIAAFSLLD